MASAIALKKLAGEYKSLQVDPLEGVVIKLPNEDDLFVWEVGIFGPPGTIYEGGYFKTQIKFPVEYPFQPPAMRFLEAFWHPNVYPTGELCISILHPPGEDAMSGERPEERWNPTQQVRTILLSVISLLNEPNVSSPANVDASVQFREWQAKKNTKYFDIVKKQVDASAKIAAAEHIRVPTTLDEYCIRAPARPQDSVDSFEEDIYNNYDSDVDSPVSDDEEDYRVSDDDEEEGNETD